ncbi:MAG: energy transducer TonB [Proteobacteria bacterium]|nr:energy transducer TonB [Pseudomonadota bacterium]
MTTVRLTTPNGRTIRLLLGSMGLPMQAMRRCTNDLVHSWGYDPATIATLSKPAEPATTPGTWLNSYDYPSDMLVKGAIGLVQFRLDVGEKGAIAGCHILDRAGDEKFATTTCALLAKRAKMHPALDKAGVPTKGFFISKVRWDLPH